MIRNNLLVGQRGAGIKITGNLYNEYGETTLLEGQVALYDPESFDILGAAPSPLTNPAIGIAMGYVNQEGMLTARLVAGDSIDAMQIINNNQGSDGEMKAQVPVCGSDHVMDVLVGCVGPGEMHGFSVIVYDERSGQRFGDDKYGEKYDFFVSSEELEMCTECVDEKDYCESVICALQNKINTGSVTGEVYEGMWGTDRKIERQMFHSVKLQEFSSTFTMGSTDSACANCDGFAGWKTFDVGGVQVDLTPYHDAAGNLTETGIYRAIKAINCSTDINVFASLRSSGQNCCGHVIDIMHCTDDIKFIDENDADVIVVADKPLENKCTKISYCKDCSATPPAEAEQLTCGIRLYFDPLKYEEKRCGLIAWPDVDVRMGQVIVSDHGYYGFEKWCVKEIAAPTLPMNLGYEWYSYEMDTANGGKGRGHQLGIGGMRRMEYQSKYFGMAVDPKEQYCSFEIPYFKTFWDDHQVEGPRRDDIRSSILFPITEVATIVAFQDAWNTYTGAVPMKNYPAIKCFADDAQEGDLPLDQDAWLEVFAVSADIETGGATTLTVPFNSAHCDPVVFTTASLVNCTVVNNKDGSFDVTPTSDAVYSFNVTVACEDLSETVSISGTASDPA